MKTRNIPFLALCMAILWFMTSSVAMADDSYKWQQHLAYNEATTVVTADNSVFALYGTNLLEYKPESGETVLYSTLSGLCETEIVRIGYDYSLKMLFVLYASGNIDIIETETGRVRNMPVLKRITDGVITINNVNVVDGEALIATDEGVVHIDMEERKIVGYYKPEGNITDATIANGIVYAATANKILFCPVTSNPLDPSEWQSMGGFEASRMVSFADGIYFQRKWGYGFTYAKYDAAIKQHRISKVTSDTYTLFTSIDNVFIAANDKGCFRTLAEDPSLISKQWEQANAWQSVSLAADGRFWTAEGENGLLEYALDDKAASPEASGVSVGSFGPKRDLFYYTTFVDGRFLVAGGRLDPSGRRHFPPTAMFYDANGWTNFGETGIANEYFSTRGNLTSIVQDPNNPNHHFATSAGFGLIEYRNYEIVEHYSSHNSPLKSAAADGNPRYVRTDGICYDAAGNLWMLNNGQDSVIKVLKTNGEWQTILADGLQYAPTLEKAIFDSKGRFWACSRGTGDGHTSGLFGLNYSGDLAHVQNDVQKFRSSAMNQDGKTCNLEYVYCIAEDRNGQIWFGNSSGLYVISNPDEWFSNNFLITQIKVPRNDGTNFADYLLSGVACTAITVDGGNRKWIGTEGSGLFLVSADGTEVLENFTVENSPLLSNNILSLSINPTTGELFIGTNQGLITYMAGVSDPLASLESDQLLVFPNPVRPEYSGDVTITGLTEGAEVRITTMAGQAVAQGYATGGSYVWNCCGTNGERVPTGVYLILANTSNGKDGAVAKVVVI